MSETIKVFFRSRSGISLALLLIVYFVGFVTVLAGQTERLMLLTPFNLLFAGILMLFNAKGLDINYIKWFLLVAVSGFTVEWIGIETGLVFGNYAYGDGLGLKLFDVPLLIGLNWAVLVFSVAAVTRNWKTKTWIRAAGAAAIMVLYDIFLEPVAIRFDFWSWESAHVPPQNYLAWWVIAWFMIMGVNKFVPVKDNRIAAFILIIQTLFFVLLIITENIPIF